MPVVPAASRLRRGRDFQAVLRSGRRAGRPLLSAHLLDPGTLRSGASRPGARPGPRASTGSVDADLRREPVPGDAVAPPLVGFTVSRRVGTAPVRNRVRRRLRELVRARLPRLPAGSLLLVRAAPAAAAASYAELGADLDRVLDRLLDRPVARSRP